MKRHLCLLLALFVAIAPLPRAWAEQSGASSAGRVLAILFTWDSENARCETADDQLANGTYRLTELLAVAVEEACPQEAVIDFVNFCVDDMHESDSGCEDAAARTRNGIHHANLALYALSLVYNDANPDVVDRIDEVQTRLDPTPESFSDPDRFLADSLCAAVELLGLARASMLQDEAAVDELDAVLQTLKDAESGESIHRAQMAFALVETYLADMAAAADADGSSLEQIASIRAEADEARPDGGEINDRQAAVMHAYHSVEFASILALELSLND